MEADRAAGRQRQRCGAGDHDGVRAAPPEALQSIARAHLGPGTHRKPTGLGPSLTGLSVISGTGVVKAIVSVCVPKSPADAIDGMPDVVSADAGTSIIARAPIPATVVSAAPTTIGSTTAARPVATGGRRVPLLIGGAAAALGAAVVVGLLRSSGDAGQSHGGGATMATLPNVATGPVLTARTDSAAPARSAPATPRPVKSVAAGGGDALSPEAIKAEITAIKDLKLGDRTSAEAIRRAEALLPKLRTGNDSAEVLLHESDAWTTRGDQTNACNTLKRIGKRGNSIVRESVVSGLQICSTT